MFPLYNDWCSLDVFDYGVPKWVFCGDGHACKGAFEVFVSVSEVASYIYVLYCRVECILSTLFEQLLLIRCRVFSVMLVGCCLGPKEDA